MAGPSDGAPALELEGISKAFGREPVLRDVSFTVAPGEFVSMVGPSGCGKTTTLNAIAGFVSPDRGDIRLGGRSVLHTPPHRRDLGMVFQNHALFPNMSIAGNVGFGLKMRRLASAEIRRRVAEALEMVQLSGLAGRYPRELSGGQQQRVGLARALTIRPQVILLDEPLSSLDAKLRREMQVELRRIQRLVGTTAIYVTHDQEEALTLSDRVVLMNRGRIEQIGTPREVYSRPANAFVAGFIGEISFVIGEAGQPRDGWLPLVLPGGGQAEVAWSGARPAPGLRLAVRPDRVRLARPPPGSGAAWTGTVASRTFNGAVDRCLVALADGTVLQAHVASHGARPEFGPGDTVAVVVRPEDWMVVQGG